MSCSLNESCKIIIESKDREIDKLIEEKDELENKLEELEKKDNYIRVFLIIQSALLMIGFQIWE